MTADATGPSPLWLRAWRCCVSPGQWKRAASQLEKLPDHLSSRSALITQVYFSSSMMMMMNPFVCVPLGQKPSGDLRTRAEVLFCEGTPVLCEYHVFSQQSKLNLILQRQQSIKSTKTCKMNFYKRQRASENNSSTRKSNLKDEVGSFLMKNSPQVQQKCFIYKIMNGPTAQTIYI